MVIAVQYGRASRLVIRFAVINAYVSLCVSWRWRGNGGAFAHLSRVDGGCTMPLGD